MQVKLVSPQSLRPNEYNPNRLSSYQLRLLKRSIERDGMVQPVLALKDGTIIDGEHRWQVCKELGIEVPTIFLERDEAERRLMTLRMNNARGRHALDDEQQVIEWLVEAGVDLNIELLISTDDEQAALEAQDFELPPLDEPDDWIASIRFANLGTARAWLKSQNLQGSENAVRREITISQ